MKRGLGIFFFIQHFLIKFFSISQTCNLYFDILRSTQLNHPLGKVYDFHRISHIEYEDFSTVSHSPRLQYQFTGFRYQHEIADNIFMGNGYRPSMFDLFLEQGDN